MKRTLHKVALHKSKKVLLRRILQIKTLRRQESSRLIGYAVLWRLLLLLPVWVAVYYIPLREGYGYTTILYYVETGLHSVWQYMPAKLSFVFPWVNFDGVHYIGIASRGYIDDGRFLPLYPVLIGLFGRVLSLGSASAYSQVYVWAGLLLSNAAFVAALWLMYRLFRLDFDAVLSRKAVAVAFLLPTSFFFVSVYAESLFLLMAVGFLYVLRKQRWVCASVLVALLSVTRLVGICLIVQLFLEKTASRKFFILPILIAPALVVAYAFFNWLHWQDPVYFITAHGQLGNSREVMGIVLPIVTLWRYVKILTTIPPTQYEFFIAFVELGMGMGAAVLTGYLTWLWYRGIVHRSYVLYSVLVLVLPAFSGTLSGFPRYTLLAFPLYIALAYWLKEKPRLAYILGTASLIMQVILLMLFARGYFVA